MATSPPFDLHYVLPAPLAAQMHDDRQFGHRMVMADYPGGLGVNPRSSAGILWRVDPVTAELIVRTRIRPTGAAGFGPAAATLPVVVAPAGTQVGFQLTRNCQVTPSSPVPAGMRGELKKQGSYRSRMVVVPEADRDDWASRRMAAAGLDVDPGALGVSELDQAVARGTRFPVVTLTGTATVTDPGALLAALTDGVGKGKNYGLGLLRIAVVDLP